MMNFAGRAAREELRAARALVRGVRLEPAGQGPALHRPAAHPGPHASGRGGLPIPPFVQNPSFHRFRPWLTETMDFTTKNDEFYNEKR